MPFEKGEKWNGNAKGRPKGSGLKLTTLLKEKMELVPEGQKQSFKEMFIEGLLEKALVGGDMNSYKLIMNYIDGLPTQKIEGDFTHKTYAWDEEPDDESDGE